MVKLKIIKNVYYNYDYPKSMYVPFPFLFEEVSASMEQVDTDLLKTIDSYL